MSELFDAVKVIREAQRVAVALGRVQLAREVSQWAIEAETRARAENWTLTQYVSALGERLRSEASP